MHERDLNTDFLLIILRDMLPSRPDLKARAAHWLPSRAEPIHWLDRVLQRGLLAAASD